MLPNGSELSCPAARATAYSFSRNPAGRSRPNFPHVSRVSCSELFGGPSRLMADGRFVRGCLGPHANVPRSLTVQLLLFRRAQSVERMEFGVWLERSDLQQVDGESLTRAGVD